MPEKMIALFFALIAFQAVAFEAHAMPILDSSFGSSGVARIGVPAGAEDTPSASVLQRDGKLLVAGWTAGRQSHAFVLRLNTNGSLDTSFGNGGGTLLDLPNGHYWLTSGQIEQRPDGSILMGAQANGGFMFTRLTADGKFDSTFAANGFFFTADSSYSARFVQQADGGILIVSDATQGTQFALRLTRLTAAGKRDLAYAPNGEKMLGSLPPDFAMASGNSVAAEPDGGFTVMARATLKGGTYLLVRVTNAGTLSTKFGAGGLVSGYGLGNPFDHPVEIVRTSDGRLLLLGNAGDSSGVEIGKIVLWRVTSGGLADVSFGATGRLDIWNGYASSGNYRIAELTNASNAVIVNQEVIMRRFDASGVPDDAFGTGGYASITLADYKAGFSPVGIMSDNNGGLLIPGAAASKMYCNLNCVSYGMDVAVASLDSAGRLHPSYGRGDGFAIWGSQEYSNDKIDTILLEPSGKVVLAGTTDEGASIDYLLARLTASGVTDTTFGTNGRVLPNQSVSFKGLVRAVETESGAITVATGTAGGTVGQFATVTAFRLASNGMLDAGFAPGFTSPMYAHTAVALRVRPDGRLLYGTVTGGSQGLLTAVLEQHLPDGSSDPSFGSNGIVTFPISFPISSGGYSRCSDIQVLADGSVVFAVLTSKSDLHVFKLDAQGAPVTSFGENGQFTYKEAVANSLSDNLTLLSLADGTLLAAIPYNMPPIFSSLPTASLLVVRISANGVLTGADKLWPENAYLNWALTALPDASVLVARVAHTDSTTRSALYRLYPDNSLDETFGLGGAYPLQGMQSVSALATDANGRILIAGQDSTSAILARYRIDWPTSGATAAEFYKADINHYFMTAYSDEAIFLDNKPDWGWARTGKTFNIWLTQASAPSSASPVCRFFGVFANGTVGSHFYTVDPTECEYVKGRLDWGWGYEGAAYYAVKPTAGSCPSGTSPVYRVYNNSMGGAPNHRYLTNQTDVNTMVSQGWVSEGTAFCGAQ